MRQRQRVLVGIFAAFALLTTVILWRVIPTVFFAVTVAYVLYPVRKRLVERGASRRVGAGAATTVGFAVVLAIVVPLLWALYSRRGLVLDYIRALPDVIEIEFLDFAYTFDIASLVPVAQE